MWPKSLKRKPKICWSLIGRLTFLTFKTIKSRLLLGPGFWKRLDGMPNCPTLYFLRRNCLTMLHKLPHALWIFAVFNNFSNNTTKWPLSLLYDRNLPDNIGMLKAFKHLRLLFESAPLPLVELLILELTPRHRHASVRVQALKGELYVIFILLSFWSWSSRHACISVQSRP